MFISTFKLYSGMCNFFTTTDKNSTDQSKQFYMCKKLKIKNFIHLYVSQDFDHFACLRKNEATGQKVQKQRVSFLENGLNCLNDSKKQFICIDNWFNFWKGGFSGFVDPIKKEKKCHLLDM